MGQVLLHALFPRAIMRASFQFGWALAGGVSSVSTGITATINSRPPIGRACLHFAFRGQDL